MKLFKSSLLLIGIILCSFACKKVMPLPKDSLSAIPGNAALVSAINTKSLMEKADFDHIKTLAFYKDGLAEVQRESPALAKIMEDPRESGIDLDKNAYMFYDMDPGNMQNVFTGFTFSIADKAKFEALLQNVPGASVESGDGFSYINSAGSGIIGWNDDMVTLGGYTGRGGDELAQIKKVFSTTKDNSIANNDKLKTAFGRNFDLASWGNTNMIAEMIKADPSAGLGLGMMGIKMDDLKDNTMYGYMDFNKGSATSTSVYDFKESITKIISPLFRSKMSTDFSDYIPKENLAFLMTTGIDLKSFQATPLGTQAVGMLSYGLKEFGLSIDDITAAIGGDIMLAGLTDPSGNTDGSGILAMSIGDESKFEKLLSLAMEYNMLTKNGDSYTITDRGVNMAMGTSRGEQAQLTVKDGKVFFTAESKFFDAVSNGGFSRGDRLDGGAYKNIAGSLMGFFVDMEQLSKMDEEMSGMAAMENMDMTWKGNKMDFNINMKDKSVNSLKAMINMANDLYLKNKNQSSRYNSYDSDSMIDIAPEEEMIDAAVEDVKKM